MSGLIAFTGPPDRELLQRMLATLRHRGSLVGPPLETPQGTIAVIEWPHMNALGMHQTQTSYSHQPQADLINRHSTESGSAKPAEAWGFSGFLLSPLPQRWSINCLSEIRGSYGCAFFAGDALIIARDAVGCQSLFYGQMGARWLVATEPKAISSQPQFSRRIRPAAVAQYLSFSFTPGAGTMLEDLWEVPAGHAVALTPSAPAEHMRIFDFEAAEYGLNDEGLPTVETANDRCEEYWIARTRQAVAAGVAERLSAGSPPTVFLSGGLDSSIVAAELARQCPDTPIKTFSIHFGDKYPHELEFARAVANRIGSQHEEVLIQPKQFLPRLYEMIWHLDEPIGDPITQPNFELAAHVRQHAQAVFNGEGGDPLFGGPKNLPMLLSHWYGVPRGENYREQAYLASYRRAYEDWSNLLTEDFRRQIDPRSDLENVLTPFFDGPRPRSFLNKLMAINIRLKGAHLILPKVDRMLAAAQLTPLSPLFDDRLTRLSFQMPPRLKLRNGIEKWVLKEAYRDLLPACVVDRPKSGMRVPVHYWFQKELKRFAASILSPRQLQQVGIFDPQRVKQLLRYDIEDGSGRYGIRLWMLLTFEIWRRIVVERDNATY